MTRKDYQLIAGAMKSARMCACYPNAPDGAAIRFSLQAAAHELAHMLAADNARFNRAKFLAACGVES